MGAGVEWVVGQLGRGGRGKAAACRAGEVSLRRCQLGASKAWLTPGMRWAP